MNAPSVPPVASTTLTVAYVNAGRATSARVAATLWGNVAHVGKRADVIVAVEVDEGDAGYSDHHLIRRLVHGFRRRAFKGSREVILTRIGLRADKPVVRRAGRPVAHWTPARPVTYDDLDCNVRIVTAHPAAGAGTQAKNRPLTARKPLQASWDRTVQVMADVITEGHDAGLNVILCTDGNSRTLTGALRQLLPPRVQLEVLALNAPDYVIGFPADGQQVGHVDETTFANPIEPKLHPGHVVTVTFEESA